MDGIIKQIENSEKNEYSELTAEKLKQFLEDVMYHNIEGFKPSFSEIPPPSVVEQMGNGYYMFDNGIYSKEFLLELSKHIHGE